MTYSAWERIFARLSSDIADRRGLKWEWEKIDDDVKAEISKAWRAIVEGEA